VIIATTRAKRPSDFKVEHEVMKNGDCPFCGGNEVETPDTILEYPHLDAKFKWRLRIVPNKYPALSMDGELVRYAEGMYDAITGIGKHEVIIESPEHVVNMADLAHEQVVDLFWAAGERVINLKRDGRFRYVMVFKNQGRQAGASLEHVHSQLIALPVVPRTVEGIITGAKRYHDWHERCVFCDIVRHELSDGRRIIDVNDDFIAIAPFASRAAFETWVIPRMHDSHFEDSDQGQISNLALSVLTVIRKLSKVLDRPPFNLMIMNAPFSERKQREYHWYLEIRPGLTAVAGFEWGSGFYINPTPPEDAAKFLRESG
jgi:UDPglucose--hexose-1-phosphate uridylyltransferase